MLLAWLDSDRERAGEKYNNIHEALIKMFQWRGCSDPEALADETIVRVMAKLPGIVGAYQGDPARYFYGVAKKIVLEYHRKERRPSIEDISPTEHYLVRNKPSELEFNCLDLCLKKLPPPRRELIIRYFQIEKRGKAADRKQLSTELGVSANELRVRANRIRNVLEKCVKNCIQENKWVE